MLDMLGQDARAAIGKVKSLQSQGATPDQVQAQMLEAARNGLLPLSVAFAAQKALQRQNAPAAPQGTVVGDMLSQLQQQPSRQQGVASLPNPVMDNAQYAGGGIVAFAGEGPSYTGGSGHGGDAFARMQASSAAEARAAAAAEAEALAAAEAAGTASPTQLTRLARLKNFLGSLNPTISIRNVAGSAIERGIGGLGTLAKTQMYLAPLFGAIGAKAQQNDVPAEYLQDFYSRNGDTSQYWKAIDTPDMGDKKFTMGEGTGPFGEVLNRTHAAVGKAANIASFGLANTDPYSQYFEEKANRATAAAAAAAPAPAAAEQAYDLSSILNQPSAVENGLAGINTSGPDMSGIRGQYNAALAGVGNTDTTKATSLEDQIAAYRGIREKAGIGNAANEQMEKIKTKQTKLDKDYSKSILTDLGLAFLTKGVMAAGEGKNTMSAMASAVESGAKTYKERRERIEDMKDKLDDREALVSGQLESLKAGDIVAGQAERNRELTEIHANQDRATDLHLKLAATEYDAASKTRDRQFSLAVEQIKAVGTREQKEQTIKLVAAATKLRLTGKPEDKKKAEYIEGMIRNLNTLDPDYQARMDAAQLNIQADKDAATKKADREGNGDPVGAPESTTNPGDSPGYQVRER